MARCQKHRFSPVIPTIATVALTALFSGATQGDSTVYRCASGDTVQFSDQPCGPGSERVEVRDNRVGGSLADNLPDYDDRPDPAPDEKEETETAEKDACRFINSTNLRTYLARNQVVPGMTREQVQQAFGRTSEVYPTPQETWVYQTKYYGALYELTYVYFRNGCVERVEYRKP